MNPSFPTSNDLKGSPIARNKLWAMNMFHSEAQTPSISSWLHTQDIHQCWPWAATMCIWKVSFWQWVPTTHIFPPHPRATGPWEQVNMHCSPSDALGRCVGLVLVLQQWPHIHAGSVKTASFIAEQVIRIKKGIIWKWICNIKLQKVKQHSSWINFPKRVCWIFQRDCEVVSLNTRSRLRFGNPEGFLQQSLSCSFY